MFSPVLGCVKSGIDNMSEVNHLLNWLAGGVGVTLSLAYFH